MQNKNIEIRCHKTDLLSIYSSKPTTIGMVRSGADTTSSVFAGGTALVNYKHDVSSDAYSTIT